MPPKKTEKASAAAETKKKNTAEANDIVAMLKRTSQREKTVNGKSRRDAAIMENLFDSAKMSKNVKTGKSDVAVNIPKKPEEGSSQSKEKSVDMAKEVVLKEASRREVAKANKTDAVTNSIQIESDAAMYGEVTRATTDLTGIRSSGNHEHANVYH